MHPLSLSHGHDLEPSLVAFLGDTLRPSSSSCPASTGQCPLQAPCCNPASRFLGKAAALTRSLSKAWEEIALSSPLFSLQIKLSPGCIPKPLCCTPPHTSLITAMSIAAPISMPNPTVPCPPWGLSHHHARDTTTPPQLLSPQGLWQCIGDPHKPRGGNAAGDKPCTVRFCAAPQPHVPALSGGCSEATSQETGDMGFIG